MDGRRRHGRKLADFRWSNTRVSGCDYLHLQEGSIGIKFFDRGLPDLENFPAPHCAYCHSSTIQHTYCRRPLEGQAPTIVGKAVPMSASINPFLTFRREIHGLIRSCETLLSSSVHFGNAPLSPEE